MEFLAFNSPIVEDGSVSEKLKIEIRSILLIEQNDLLVEIPTIIYWFSKEEVSRKNFE